MAVATRLSQHNRPQRDNLGPFAPPSMMAPFLSAPLTLSTFSKVQNVVLELRVLPFQPPLLPTPDRTWLNEGSVAVTWSIPPLSCPSEAAKN